MHDFSWGKYRLKLRVCEPDRQNRWNAERQGEQTCTNRWPDLRINCRRNLGTSCWRNLGTSCWRNLGTSCRRNLGTSCWRYLRALTGTINAFTSAPSFPMSCTRISRALACTFAT